MKHTPGPWKWMDYPDGRKLLLSRDRAVIHCPDAPMTCDPVDARLIAAAPELLEACELFTAAAHEVRDILNSKGFPCPASIALAAEKARNAIARVEGVA